MAGNDRFAEIALAAHPVGDEQLYEAMPPQIPKTCLKQTNRSAAVINTKCYDDRLEDFKKGLADLKQKFLPFMMNHTPDPLLKQKCLELKSFDFRYQQSEDLHDFCRVLEGRGEWIRVDIPDYRGPVGKWRGFYRTGFLLTDETAPGKRVFLKFLGVDYIANIYINGRFIGCHEGFFFHFEFDITDYLMTDKENILVVEVINDAPTIGLENDDGSEGVDGDKIYAATGPGWDDPTVGWHHCPPGAGIYNRVILEERSRIFTYSAFARPDIDNAYVEAWIEVYNTGSEYLPFELLLSVYPYNFNGTAAQDIVCPIEPAGPGINYYRFKIPMPEYRLWSPETPWLYTLRTKLIQEGELLDEYDCRFGMRKFHMDVTNEPFGTLYLNNRPVILRGANDMGHMQQCVMKGDFDQLAEDILIGRLANMNFYRFTQRPVQKEIYDYCDMLGMMNQTDLPLFGYLRRNQFSEAVRQAGEMERHIRPHPSAVMISYINEPFSSAGYKKGHRHLYRDELESFFEAATRNVHMENPDRVIKNAEGDYDPPTRSGLSDFHCYNMWYTNHALPVGKLHKGYLPSIRKKWKTGCGEYGVEGLDHLSVMLQDYPGEWLNPGLDGKWTPEKIVKSQTYSMHGDWYEEKESITDWIASSQRHQAFAVKIMTDAIRRRSDLIISSAVHLLIDAWPAGWMKALVDHRRTPKPAYFELQKSYRPLRVNLRTDRQRIYCGDHADIEVWVLNDTSEAIENHRITATVRTVEKEYFSFGAAVNSGAACARCTGKLEFLVPVAGDAKELFIDVQLEDSMGIAVDSERLELLCYKREFKDIRPAVYFSSQECMEAVSNAGLAFATVSCIDDKPQYILLDSLDSFMVNSGQVLNCVNEGASALLLMDSFDSEIKICDGLEIKTESMSGVFFAARNPDDPLTAGFGPEDFSYWYSRHKDCMSFIATKYINGKDVVPLLFTYEKPSFHLSAKGRKRELPVAGYVKMGKGRMYFTTIPVKEYSGFNPVLDRFMHAVFNTAD